MDLEILLQLFRVLSEDTEKGLSFEIVDFCETVTDDFIVSFPSKEKRSFSYIVPFRKLPNIGSIVILCRDPPLGDHAQNKGVFLIYLDQSISIV